MINSDKARELARRSIFNNIDEQLRYLFEDIEETASMDGFKKVGSDYDIMNQVAEDFNKVFGFTNPQNESGYERR